MTYERTFVMIKPEGLERFNVGEIITRFEKKGFELIGLKLTKCSEDQAKTLYKIHEGKDFYQRLIKHICEKPVIAMILGGEDAISTVRKMIGPTDPNEGYPGEIRFDFSQKMPANAIHASDSVENVDFESKIFFSKQEFIK
jgi:nucleoside-diphosphate kinase